MSIKMFCYALSTFLKHAEPIFDKYCIKPVIKFYSVALCQKLTEVGQTKKSPMNKSLILSLCIRRNAKRH